MKAVKILTALALSAGMMATAGAAVDANKITKRGTVHYSCQSGKNVSVSYGFNAAGVPVTATAKLEGKTRVLRYDMNRSDNVGTFFKDARGYDIGADELNSRNFRKASLMITSPKNQILFKSCMPR